MLSATVLYTSADASPQSGAFRNLLFLIATVQSVDLKPILVTHCSQKDSTLGLVGPSIELCFVNLPRAKRQKSWRYLLGYARDNLIAISILLRTIRQEAVDIVHVNEITDFYGAIAAKLAGKPCVWHVRAGFESSSFLEKMIPRLCNLLATRIVVASESVYREKFPFLNIEEGQLIVLYDPVSNPETFHADGYPDYIRDEFKLRRQQPLIVLVAKLIEQKGHDIVIRAVPEVLRHHPEAMFLIVGGDVPGKHHEEYAARIRALPSDLCIKDNVIFTGFRADVAEIMAAADLVLHCSKYPDPFPGVVLEAMSLGKAIIASNVGGPVEQLEHDVSGFLIEPDNPAALSQAIITLLDNPSTRKRFGEAAVKRINAKFSTEQFTKELLSIYGEVLSGASR